MKIFRRLKAFALIASVLSFSAVISGQFPIKIPKISKPDKPQPTSTDRPTDSGGSVGSGSSISANTKQESLAGRIYEYQAPPDTPVVIHPQVFIEAANSRTYWKMPNASNTTSWLPELKVHLFWADRTPLKTVAEFYNPDGSLWFTESLQTSGKMLRSNQTWTLMDTKSTNATGVFSVKVKDTANGSVIYAGKFKVNKFLNSFNAADKNKLGFYVDHDWLTPLGMVYFVSPYLDKGLNGPYFSVWLKGDINYSELEAQLHFNGKMIANKKVNSGSPTDSRMSSVMIPLAKDNITKRWDITFQYILLHNGNSYNVEDNQEFFDQVHLVDKNPGKYTFRMICNGTPIREFSFTVGSDGRFVRPAYSDSFTVPYHGILVTAKVIGTTEKWNATSWKTDMFYGNTIAGFTVP